MTQAEPLRRVLEESRIACVATAVLIFCCWTTAAAQTGLQLDDLRIDHQLFTLDNGLTLIVHEDHSVPIVAVNVWYHVGSKNERRGRTGFAHLFEHFFFNGSENYPFGFREAMDDLGANNRNGTTNSDRTNFFEDVPVSALERTLYLEADRMGFLAGNLSEEMLERERGVVQNEKRQGENQPYGKVWSRILETIYPYSHPYSWSTIGSMEDLDAATLDDIREWYESYYGPNNAVLSLAGDISAERALELVNTYFGPIPPGPPVTRYERWIPALDGKVRDVMVDRVPQARVYRVYQAPPWGDAELEQMRLAASVLSGSKSARLDRRLVYETELATSITAGLWEREMGSLMYVIATVKPEVDPAEVEREIDAVMSRFLDEGPTTDEVQRARSRFLSDFTRGLERLGGFGGRSDVLAESMTYGGSPDAYLDNLNALLSATLDDIGSTARQWLGSTYYTLVVKPMPEYAPTTNSLDRSILPDIGAPGEALFPDIQRGELANGLRIILLERHTAPLVNMTLVVDAGYAADPKDGAGTASLAVGLLDDGTSSRDAFQITDDLDRLGAEISTSSNLDQSMVRLRSLRTNLDRSLPIFADVVLNPAFPADMVELEKQRRIAQIGQEKAQPIAAALRIVPRLLYGSSHSYSVPFTGSGYEFTVRAIDRADLVEWHDTWFRPGNSVLVVTGDVAMPDLLSLAENAFRDWRPAEVPRKAIGNAQQASRGKVYLVDKKDAPQSVITAAHLSRPGGDDADLAMETVMTLFGGMSTSRLNRNLRLDKHWSYGTWGLLWDARGRRPFMVVAPVQSDKTREAMIEVEQEIRGIAGARPVVGEEYESIMRNMTLRLPGRFETLSSLENAAIDLVNYGYPDTWYRDYGRNVRSLTPEDLASAAAAFVQPQELVWIIIGDVDKIADQIESLDYGEVVKLDANGDPLP